MVDTLPSKFLACLIPVGTFVVLGYEHSIANMFFIPAGMLEGADVDLYALFRNLIPVTIGNIIGGAILVGTLFNALHSTTKP
jgi:Formate/nitrite family of transporters